MSLAPTNFLATNPAAKALFKWRVRDMLGKPAVELFGPEQAERVKAHARQLADEQQRPLIPLRRKIRMEDAAQRLDFRRRHRLQSRGAQGSRRLFDRRHGALGGGRVLQSRDVP